jgi:transposase-like protein
VAVIGLLAMCRLRATRSWGPGSVLVELSVVEQRYRAVLAVLAGESMTEVAAQIGVSRQTLHAWLARYRDDGLGGLIDRSQRPEFCPHQSPVEVDAAVCELRREHPRWEFERSVADGHQRLDAPVVRGAQQPDPSLERARPHSVTY